MKNEDGLANRIRAEMAEQVDEELELEIDEQCLNELLDNETEQTRTDTLGYRAQ